MGDLTQESVRWFSLFVFVEISAKHERTSHVMAGFFPGFELFGSQQVLAFIVLPEIHVCQ